VTRALGGKKDLFTRRGKKKDHSSGGTEVNCFCRMGRGGKGERAPRYQEGEKKRGGKGKITQS